MSWMLTGAVRRRIAAGIMVVTAVALLGLASPAAAEDPKPAYTRVGLWDVDRAHWGKFVEFFEKYDKPVMEKMMADGVIFEWGIDGASLHTPEGYSHATWFSATSLGNLEKALAAYEDFYDRLSKEEQTRSDSEFAAMILKHRDYVLRHLVMRSKAADLEGAYFLASTGQVKAGHGRDFRNYWDHRVMPVYEKLFANGTILSYGLTVEEIQTEKPGGRESWCIVKDADGLDAVQAAFEASWDDLPDEESRARWASIVTIMEEGSYREHMSKTIMGRQSDR